MTRSNRSKREGKKTEALEIRVSHTLKTDFMSACKAAGRSASDVLRDAMRGYAGPGSWRRARWRLTMLATITVGISAFSILMATSDDVSADGMRLYGAEEFRRLDANLDRRVTLDEVLEEGGTARAGLARDSDPGRYGRTIGVLFAGYPAANGIDLSPLSLTPEAISAECWALLEAAWSARQSADFANWDANADGVVTLPEFSANKVARLRHTFGMMDADGNGVITSEDYIERGRAAQSYREAPSAPITSDTPEHLTTCLPQLPAREPADREIIAFTPYGAEAIITRFDADGDRQVSFEEYISLGF